MSVGRFQLALRALDLRAAPCPRGLLRPSGSVVDVRPLFGGPNPALRDRALLPCRLSAHQQKGMQFPSRYVCPKMRWSMADRTSHTHAVLWLQCHVPITRPHPPLRSVAVALDPAEIGYWRVALPS